MLWNSLLRKLMAKEPKQNLKPTTTPQALDEKDVVWVMEVVSKEAKHANELFYLADHLSHIHAAGRHPLGFLIKKP